MENELINKNRKFFNRLAGNYDTRIFQNWLVNIMGNIIDSLEIARNHKILDAGCGTGNLLGLLQNKKIKHLYGIDISEKMLVIAKRKLDDKVKLSQVSAEDAHFNNNFFDYVFSTEAFHHYSNYELVMKNFHRILKKNGSLVILDFDFILFNGLFHLIEPGNNKMHSAKEFRCLFQKSGFKNIKQKRIGLFFILTIGRR